MAPTSRIKTYSRSNKSLVNSVDAGKVLFQSGRLKGKKKRKFVIKELPARAVGESALVQDSFHVSTEDTFDKLFKGRKKPLNIKSHISIVNISDSISKSIRKVDKFYSPIITRRKKKVGALTDISNQASFNSEKNKSEDSQLPRKVNWSYSPIMTRNKVSHLKNVSDNTSNMVDNSLSLMPRFKEPSSERIDVSLEVEKGKKPEMNSLSYIVIPKVTANNKKPDASFDPIFTNTFREKQLIHSSTPLAPLKSKKIVNQTISPIKNVSTFVDCENGGIPEVSFSKNLSMSRTHDTRRVEPEVPEEDCQLLADSQVVCSQTEIRSGFNDREYIERKTSETGKLRFTSEPSNLSRTSYITLRRRKVFKNENREVNKLIKSLEASEKTAPPNKPNAWSEQGKNINETHEGCADEIFINQRLDKNKTSRKSYSMPIYGEKLVNSNSKIESSSNVTSKNHGLCDSNSQDSQSELSLEKVNATEDDDKENVYQTDVSSMFVNKKRQRFTESYIISNKRIKTADVTSRNTFHNDHLLEYTEVSLKDLFVPLPKINFFQDDSTNSSLIDFIEKSRFTFSNTDTCTSRGSSLSENDFFGLKHPILKNLMVDVTRLDIELQPSKIDSCETTNYVESKRGSISPSISNLSNVESQTLSDLSHTTEKHNFTRQQEILNGIRKSIESSILSGDKKTRESSFMNLNNETLFDSDYITKRTKSFEPVDPENSEDIGRTNVDLTPYMSGTKTPKFAAKELSVNLIRSPWRKSCTMNVLSSPSDSLDSVIDLMDSLESSGARNSNDIFSTPIPKHSLSDIIESSVLGSSRLDSSGFRVPLVKSLKKRPLKALVLKAGKLWRRSLAMYKRSSMILATADEEVCRLADGNCCACTRCGLARQNFRMSDRRLSIRIVPAKPVSDVHREVSVLENYAQNASYVSDRILEDNLENDLRSLSLSRRKNSVVQNSAPVTARELVLKRCGQIEPLPFEECYPKSVLHNCQKIGEGVYGEVFLFKNPKGGTSVMKVIPIEGDLMVNGERQKKFEEILSEITIALELSNLRNKKQNCTNGFSEVQKVCCVQGRYPEKLIDLWDLYDETRGSENDSPEIFGDDQLYIVLQLANGGSDLEAFIFNNSVQAYTMFQQVALSLAVAEEELSFEHRDLHWGNVLLSAVDKNAAVTYRLEGKNYEVMTKGVQVSIIDFTLSRIECEGVVIFNDLGLDPDLFTAEGDYQFEIYKLMQKKNGNNWQRFEPYTNVLWLHYVLDKAVTALRYKHVQTKVHKEYLRKLSLLKEEILNYNSVKEFVLGNF